MCRTTVKLPPANSARTVWKDSFADFHILSTNGQEENEFTPAVRVVHSAVSWEWLHLEKSIWSASSLSFTPNLLL